MMRIVGGSIILQIPASAGICGDKHSAEENLHRIDNASSLFLAIVMKALSANELCVPSN